MMFFAMMEFLSLLAMCVLAFGMTKEECAAFAAGIGMTRGELGTVLMIIAVGSGLLAIMLLWGSKDGDDE